jgi:sugar lactone lactonase YvrE
MRIFLRAVFVVWCGIFLSACGGGGSGNASSPTSANSPANPVAGSSLTMTANTSVYVPAGTTVTAPNGTTITVSGSSNTFVTQVGAVVNVPASATGPANNVVTTGAASTSTLSTSPLSVTSLAGSASTNLNPTDGTGAAAIFWGGGHLAVDSAGNVVLSDRGMLRKVTQAGVVTTLATQGNWDGVAIDPSGNIYGSSDTLGITSGVTWQGSLQELSASGAYQQLFTNWESSSANPSTGDGGLVMDSKGALFLADTVNNRIVKFDVGSNTWAVFAGSGTTGNQDGVGTSATFTLYGIPDLAIDSNDNLYVRSLDTVRKIAPDGTVTTIASQLQTTGAIAVDKSGNIYTTGFGKLERIASDGSVASYPFPNTTDFITSLATDSSGNLYMGTRGLGAQVFKITFPNN